MTAQTSLEAYHEAIKPTMHEQHRRVLTSLHRLGNATISEIVADTGLYHKTAQNRLSELRSSGLIIPTEDTRRNSRNRSETVVRLA